MLRQVWGYIHDNKYYCVMCAEKTARSIGLDITDDVIDAEDWEPVYNTVMKAPRCNGCGVTKGCFVPQR